MVAGSWRKLLHGRLWQRLPPSSRRALLFHITSFAAPRPTPAARPALPILVAGTLHTASGLGAAARLSHDALKAGGLPVYGIDLSTALMQPQDHTDCQIADGRAITGPGVIILHVNSPLVPLAMLRLGRRVVRGKRIIGYWTWELPLAPAEWWHGVPFVHEIWTPSRFAAAAMVPIASGRPIRIVPHPVAAAVTLHPVTTARAPRSPFTIVTAFDMASSFARKNPLAAIDAFRTAFGNDPTARLIVKMSNASVFRQGYNLIKDAARSANNIVVINETLDVTGINALYAEADAVVSLHRSEGFGLILAEAMLRGLPVVATDWSGNVDFLTAKTGIPIRYRLVPAEDAQGTYHHPDMRWAAPDIDAAASALRRLRDDPALRARLGRAAADFAAQTWSTEAFNTAVRRLLANSRFE
jgi:glycosyltransferase involved in cell wall biosynthesis